MPTAFTTELHAASAFSFLRGGSLPEDLAEAAARCGLSAVALTDRSGIYGAPRFYKAAKALNLRPIVGAEVVIRRPGENRDPLDPRLGGDDEVLTLLVANRAGYRNLCRLLTAGAVHRPKGESLSDWDQLALYAEGLYCLAGAPSGILRGEAGIFLDRLTAIYPGRVFLEIQRHLVKKEEQGNRALIRLAREKKIPLAAANGPRYAKTEDKELVDVLTCVRRHTTLEAARGDLEENRERYFKTPEEMARLFADLPEALDGTARLAECLQFTLADLGYRFPDYPLPPNETPISYLRRLTWESAHHRFHPLTDRVRAQLEKELALIEKLELAGYFLIVWDIVQFCFREKIMVQGRGSAANSAVCYALSITAVDPVKMDLLFERFLSEERGEWPDIDLDLPSGDQREKAIQYLYDKYGAHGAAMTANVITYRGRSAIREAGKAFGLSMTQVDALSKHVGRLSLEDIRLNPPVIWKHVAEAGLDPRAPQTRRLMTVWMRLQNLPRHLGQHSGGMVVAGNRLDEVVPLEPASMPGRVVMQWDKEDCADLGLIKIDLLGLGMLAALEEALPLIKKHEGVTVDLAHLPPDDPLVFKMLREADTVGVFQVESRAQMASLPRNAPTTFYDLVVQVAIIRPGPIVGGMVQPFFDRRQGKAPVEYPHPSLEPILKRTLGVPLFQEQVLRMAMTAAGFSGGQAEELRRAMGFKRSMERMESIEKKLREGMNERGITGPAQEQILRMITSFALYGFPESHAASFALLAYASAYLKAHHPAAFTTSLLNAWPMGFYHPSTLVQDAQRHAVEVRPIDVNFSSWKCDLENGAMRLGLSFVKGLRQSLGTAIETARLNGGAFQNADDLARRGSLHEDDLSRLAYAGALGSLGLERREALWQVARAARSDGPLFEATERGEETSPLRPMTAMEETLADYQAMHLTTGPHVVAHLRQQLTKDGVMSATELENMREGARVRTAGAVIVRQRPGTAKGFVFITLEDETGMCQVIVSPRLYQAQRGVILSSAGLIAEGWLQKQPGNLSIRAEDLRALPLGGGVPSHDFH